MTSESTSPRLFLTDSAGDYFVLTPEMKEPAKIPSEHKHEVDEVLGKEGEVWLIRRINPPGEVIKLDMATGDLHLDRE